MHHHLLANFSYDSCHDGRYSSGLELAKFVVALDILHDAWTVIWSLYTEISQNEGPSSFVRFKVYDELPNYTIIAFFTRPSSSKDSVQGGGGNLVSSSTFKGSFPFFDFLCPRPKYPDNQKNKPKDDPSFSINETAFQLFESIFGVLSKIEVPLYTLKNIFYLFIIIINF